ncbi:hypothetical protein GcC1_105020b [Golovinomyces cichoracearum]|uniref:Uncharacterized protein n=1 Tax=Golovinomyces cichoracearum TaxID=62708 RepID=A0A420I9K8_9PEZI|nr:hypothetical protein GcC1_105020b [Golovinomyces cichoracearum]
MSPTTNNVDYQELTLPNFDRAGSYNGTIPASKWLLRLKYDFRRAGYNPPPGELYLEAIKMLLDGSAADGLAATPSTRRIINAREIATPENLIQVNEWIKEEFPGNFEENIEQDIQSEIQTFAQRIKDDQNLQKPETILAYYQRAGSPSLKLHITSLDRVAKHHAQLCIKCASVTLDCVKRSSREMEPPVVPFGKHMTSSSQLNDQTGKELVDKHRLSKLEEFVSSQYGRSEVSILADIDAGRSVYSLGSQSSQRTNYVTPSTRTIPLNRQMVAPLNNSKDRQPEGTDRKPPRPSMLLASRSLHPIINGSKPHNPAADGLLCHNCGDFGHRRREYRNPSLPHWE